jgi:hypothetical protein
MNCLVEKTDFRPVWVKLGSASLCSLVTLCVFAPALTNDFVAFDDQGYIVENKIIETLDWQTIAWAFTNFYEHNWHPLTVLSLALDRQIWDLDPFGFHLTNILFHSATVFIVCLLYMNLFERLLNVKKEHNPWSITVVGASIFGALFFGCHPLRVESIVWASERKDVLCLFFMTTAIYVYVRFYVTARGTPLKTIFFSYSSVLLFAVLALLSKPTAVSLPALLLIVDWYPFNRISDLKTLLRSVLEKVPLFLMVLATVVMTLFAQHEALIQAPVVSFFSRLLIACKAITFYLWQTIWPIGLSPLYLHPGDVQFTAFTEHVTYALVVSGWLLIALFLSKSHKLWLAVSLFYLVSLVPMLGLVQVGWHWMANRYTYLPAVGLSFFWAGGTVWLISTAWEKGARWTSYQISALIIVHFIFLFGVTSHLIPVWKNTETLATRVITLMPLQSGVAYFSRAQYRFHHGRYMSALDDIETALLVAQKKNLNTKYASLYFLKAKILNELGRSEQAYLAMGNALKYHTGSPPAAYLDLHDYLKTISEQSKKRADGNLEKQP